ncbi:ROK family protein [Belliella kenyensis]|uniref:ROK family protein n=1 Tax=Belliella kenyensis TaxID=1472724 RepID=A0ABV8EJ52_9BACT|nr:ROK family protein [Belliella kenyensis]MCH7400392.1 ROK family protein [Belliella kenyensis]MDN3604590.1 ROK family protein [Belliella kenyensis]
MKILVIDIGGSNVKVRVNNGEERRKIPSGNFMTPTHLVREVMRETSDWEYEVISIGIPGVVKQGRIATEPVNLGSGWRDFDFESAFGKPVKIMNDAAMQALGSYEGGVMLFLGLGTGLGSALVSHGHVIPMELAHLSYKKGVFEDYVGKRGFQKLGASKWNKHVNYIVRRFDIAFNPDEIVLGGGNSKHITKVPHKCRLGNNHMAYEGGLRMWDNN